jgi:hypothetical protein
MPPGRALLACAMATCVLAALAAFDCAHTRKQTSETDSGTSVSARSSGGTSPWITYSKTGGVAGFRLVLKVYSGGNWLAEDLSRNRQKQGSFMPTEMDSLRAALRAVPGDQWGTYPSSVVDDFHYKIEMDEDGVVRTLDSGGTTMPTRWQPVLYILERPWPLLFQAGH